MSSSTNVIQFASGTMPQHIAQARAAGQAVSLNANASAGITGGWANIGYRGRNWRVKFRGDETLLQASAGTDHQGRPLPAMPVPHLDVLIVGIASGVSKQYYAKNFADGDDQAPDCYSVNGVAPDRSVAPHKKQNDNCPLCPQNRFGSRVTDNGKKAKACADRRRIAVVPDGDPENAGWGGPMMLNMSQSSLANLDRYCRELEKFNTDVTQVVTRMAFNLDVAYPEITFVAAGWIEDPAHYQTALEWSRSDEVRRMLEEEFDAGGSGGAIEGTHSLATSALTAPPPVHVVAPPVVSQPPVAPPVAAPAGPFAKATVKAPNGAGNGVAQAAPQAPAQAPKRGPGRPPGSANKTAPTVQEPTQALAQAAAPAPALTPTQDEAPGPVIQGVPPDMEETIDNLLA